MRVLWITSSFYPQVGGEETLIAKTVGCLTDLCEVGLVTKPEQWYPGKEPVEHFTVGPPTLSREAVWEQIHDIVLRFSPDVVHFGNARSSLCRVAVPAWMPAVATVHGNDLTAQRASTAQQDPTPHIVHSLNTCDYIFAVSRHTSSLVQGWGVKTPVKVLTPGCDIDFFRPSSELGEQARRAWRIPGHLRIILTVSRLVPRKGHVNVLEAIDQLPFRSHWVVVGDGPCREQLSAAIAERGMEHQVSMLGEISDLDLVGVYNACDVFVLTPDERRTNGLLDSEGFGLVLHEAGACGKPVIASASGGCQDAVIDGGTGILVSPSNPARLAEALELVLMDASLATRLGAAGLSSVRFSGGWARLARQIFDMYEQILSQVFSTRHLNPSTMLEE